MSSTLLPDPTPQSTDPLAGVRAQEDGVPREWEGRQRKYTLDNVVRQRLKKERQYSGNANIFHMWH